MRNLQKTVKACGVLFLVLGLSTFSWASGSDFDSKVPNFTTEIGDDVVAQTSEVTITLEKSIPKSFDDSSSIETAQGIARSSQDPQTYEDLEDPFAGDSEDLPIMSDPFEGYNRWMFGVNETIYDNVLEPVARGYRNTIHENLRVGIKNVFSNALAPVKFVSSLIQLDFEKSGRVLARTLINTTFGIGGLADVAGEEYHIQDVNEDFDQAMGAYGVPTGPYVVLPIFGPSTARNIIGRAADSLMSPSFLFAPGGISVGLSVEENINSASFIVDDKKQLEESALDEYESVRDFFHQYRHGLVKK
ncbi:MAG: VacJ family lipoprotein [Nitrospina sp.]|jgi:phospholipid-binding lipoprotein MlaA|nr:VacJ family lipoprotein [Nitrospina sp.]